MGRPRMVSEAEAEASTGIVGHVTDEGGRPIGGARVTCNGKEARTLFDGSYRFGELAPGPHIVEIALDGYGRQRRQIDTEEGEDAVLDFNLEPETGDAVIFGYVLEEETGEPAGIGGSLYMIRHTHNRNATIDPKTGYFEFTHLPPGTYTIWTSILEYEDLKKDIEIEGGERRRTDFHIHKKEPEEVPWG